MGRSENELLDSHLPSLVAPDDVAFNPLDEIEQLAAQRRAVVKRFATTDGHLGHVSFLVSSIRDDDGRPRFFVLQAEDVGRRRAARTDMDETQDRFRSVADSAPAIWTGDAALACDYVNQAWLDFTGRTLDDELGAGWTDCVHPDDRPEVLSTLADAVAGRETVELEFRMRRHDGQERWLLAAWRARLETEAGFVGYVGSCVDITDRKLVQLELETLLAESGHAQEQLVAQARRLHHLADYDSLTGVLNRRSFREQFKREWSRAVRYDRSMACVMLDIDYFKRVNDAHGHATGDAVLKRVAELLMSQCRPSDRVCRYGGEEFCIMAPETNGAAPPSWPSGCVPRWPASPSRPMAIRWKSPAALASPNAWATWTTPKT